MRSSRYDSFKLAPFALIVLILFVAIQKCSSQSDSTEIKLNSYKQLFINGTITSAEYEALRKQTLGIQIVQPENIKPDTLTYEEQVKANEMFRKGESDAYKHFKTGGVFGGTFVATLFCSPLIGLIPAIACSSSPPKEERFINDNAQLFKNADYMRGYKKRAAKSKRSNAWAAWGAGFAVDVLIGTVTGVIVSQRNPKR